MYTTERDLQGSIVLICLRSKSMRVHLTFGEGVPSSSAPLSLDVRCAALENSAAATDGTSSQVLQAQL